MSKRYYYRAFRFLKFWLFKAKLFHCLECCVYPFANILIGRISKFIDYSHNARISCKLSFCNVGNCNMAR